MSRVFVIAEAGVNHNGSLEMAKRLVQVAVESGADAVKFQTFHAAGLVSRTAEKAAYQQRTTSAAETQYEMLERLELNEPAHRTLQLLCAQTGIQFLSTPFDDPSIDLLAKLGLEIFKVPSGEITNLPYLRRVGGLAKRVILSTGMADMREIGDALAVLAGAGMTRDQITVLHATTEYPTSMEEVNLRAMQTIGAAFGVKVGYSDHTPGIEVATAAVAMGASVIEKHFTLDRTLPGPDHRASLEPSELKAMVAAIRNISTALGDGIKRPTPSEAKNMSMIRKSIVAACPIRRGEIFGPANMTTKRPGTGMSPMRWSEVEGKPAPRDFAQDEPLCP